MQKLFLSDQRIARPIDKVKLFPEFPDLSEDPVSVILKRHDPEFPGAKSGPVNCFM